MTKNRDFAKGQAQAFHSVGLKSTAIAKHTGIPRTTVNRWIAGGFEVERKHGSGRPLVTTQRTDRQIARYALRNPESSVKEMSAALCLDVSARTVNRRLHAAGFHSRKQKHRFRLSESHRRRRLEWGMRLCLWRLPSWRRIVFSDEASIRMLSRDGRLRVWVRSKDAHNRLMLPIVQGGGGSLLIWGAIWFGGRTKLWITRHTMNAERYVRVLEDMVYPISHELGDPSTQWMFAQDNAPPHTSIAAKEYCRAASIRCLPWPSCSPDMNPIENVWAWLKRVVRRKVQPGNCLDKLAAHITSAWESMPQEMVDRYISRMPERIGSLIKEKGGHTDY